MSLYLLKKHENEEINVYARVPQHIIDLVDHYREEARQNGDLDNPRLGKWLSKPATIDDIAEVEKGFLRYHAGMVCLNPDEVDMAGDFFSERFQATDDFEVAVSSEGISHFIFQRQHLLNSKRGELYKFHVTNALFGGLYFVPEDVMKGIVGYDLTSHIEEAVRLRKKIEEVKAGHPNLA